MANQINLGTYQRGIDFYNMYIQQIQNSRQYISIALYKAYCHLFIRQDSEAIMALPVEGTFTEHHNLLFRMVYLIAFIIRQDNDLARNECNNLMRITRTQNDAHLENYDWILSLYSIYLKTWAQPLNNRKSIPENLKMELRNNQARVKDLMVNEFGLKWLVEEITQEMKTNNTTEV